MKCLHCDQDNLLGDTYGTCATCWQRIIRGRNAGKANPNRRYTYDDSFFSDINSDKKAYLLGWIASDGSVTRCTISVVIHKKDILLLEELRNLVCREIPIKAKKNTPLVGISFNSQRMVADVCQHLKIYPQKKDSVVRMPSLSTPLTWAFIRGFFDGDGCVANPYLRAQRGWPSPRCEIASNSDGMRADIAQFTNIKCTNGKNTLEWNGVNALDFMSKIYDHAPIYLHRKRALYFDWMLWKPARHGHYGVESCFRWVKAELDGVAPSKSNASDSGYDLTVTSLYKKHGPIYVYDTGIKVQPVHGLYFDLVARSSLAGKGFMLANSMGIIDRGYVGTVKVPLIKIDPSGPDLELPAKVAQLIPRQLYHLPWIKVENFDETIRSDGGFGSTDVIK